MTKRIGWVDSESFHTEGYRDFISLSEKDNRIDIQLYQWAEEALEKIGATKFDLIVINTYLSPGEGYPKVAGWQYEPNAVGLDLVERIKGSPQNQKTPVIVIAVDSLEKIYEEEGGKDYILGKGASEVIDLKEMLPSEFIGVVRKYLGN